MSTAKSVAPVSAPGRGLWPMEVTFDELRVRLPDARLNSAGVAQDIRGARYCRQYLASLFENNDALTDFIAFRHHRTALYCFPAAPENRIGPICDFIQLMLAVDDLLDVVTDEQRVTSTHHADIKALLQGLSLCGDSPMAPVAAAMADLVIELVATGMSRRQADRFLTNVAAYAEGCLRENASKVTGEVHDLASYREAHLDASGQAMVLSILEYSRGIDIGTELHASPALRLASHNAFWHIQLVNSLFSYRKEMLEETTPTNLVTVLTQHQGLSQQAAVDSVCGEIRSAEAAYYRARDEAFSRASPNQDAIRTYLDGLDDLLSGAIAFNATHPRYHGHVGTWLREEPLAGTMRIYPDRTEFTGPALLPSGSTTDGTSIANKGDFELFEDACDENC